ncbi:hypothetical protein DMC30DRAFT_174748 [Rhodotorula diobovata]|uniref:Uncharacterized protein n=1 Tax=Rhodotorula diobovata TaxID=5288 RepID=A0A5C5FZ93_9BASI|nr:hypothetical protein DMC30DRAFT_174748 [Rhodotorula diobovata]
MLGTATLTRLGLLPTRRTPVTARVLSEPLVPKSSSPRPLQALFCLCGGRATVRSPSCSLLTSMRAKLECAAADWPVGHAAGLRACCCPSLDLVAEPRCQRWLAGADAATSSSGASEAGQPQVLRLARRGRPRQLRGCPCGCTRGAAPRALLRPLLYRPSLPTMCCLPLVFLRRETRGDEHASHALPRHRPPYSGLNLPFSPPSGLMLV